MAILDDIAAAFRSPRAEMDHQMSIMTEPRIMMLGLTACCLSFVSELPAIAANVSIAGESIDVLNGRAGALFITRVFFGVLLIRGNSERQRQARNCHKKIMVVKL